MTLRAIVLRPAPGGEATAQALRAMGIVADCVPLFAMEALDPPPLASDGCDAVMLTSANAVRFGGPLLDRIGDVPVHCVGEATAAAARAAGLRIGIVGDAGAQALVDRIAQHADPPRHLLWIAGEVHRQIACPDGLQLEIVPVYRARACAVPAQALSGPAVVLVHSAGAAERLASLVTDRAQVQLVAISAAAAAAAGPGWAAIHVAPRPRNAELLAIAAKLCQE